MLSGVKQCYESVNRKKGEKEGEKVIGWVTGMLPGVSSGMNLLNC